MIWDMLFLKAIFDKGLSLTNYAKYLVALFAFWEISILKSVELTLVIGLSYFTITLIIGYLWFWKRFIDVENDIQNFFNPFQREVREHIKNGKFK